MKENKSYKIFIVLNIAICCITVCEITSDRASYDTSNYILSDSNGIISVYENGKEITREYKEKQRIIQTCIADFLNREYHEIEFEDYCEMGNEGATVDVVINDERFTFTCDNTGSIQTVVRSMKIPHTLNGIRD